MIFLFMNVRRPCAVVVTIHVTIIVLCMIRVNFCMIITSHHIRNVHDHRHTRMNLLCASDSYNVMIIVMSIHVD